MILSNNDLSFVIITYWLSVRGSNPPFVRDGIYSKKKPVNHD